MEEGNAEGNRGEEGNKERNIEIHGVKKQGRTEEGNRWGKQKKKTKEERETKRET